jgi:hypothetical protein
MVALIGSMVACTMGTEAVFHDHIEQEAELKPKLADIFFAT